MDALEYTYEKTQRYFPAPVTLDGGLEKIYSYEDNNDFSKTMVSIRGPLKENEQFFQIYIDFKDNEASFVCEICGDHKVVLYRAPTNQEINEATAAYQNRRKALASKIALS